MFLPNQWLDTQRDAWCSLVGIYAILPVPLQLLWPSPKILRMAESEFVAAYLTPSLVLLSTRCLLLLRAPFFAIQRFTRFKTTPHVSRIPIELPRQTHVPACQCERSALPEAQLLHGLHGKEFWE